MHGNLGWLPSITLCLAVVCSDCFMNFQSRLPNGERRVRKEASGAGAYLRLTLAGDESFDPSCTTAPSTRAPVGHSCWPTVDSGASSADVFGTCAQYPRKVGTLSVRTELRSVFVRRHRISNCVILLVPIPVPGGFGRRWLTEWRRARRPVLHVAGASLPPALARNTCCSLLVAAGSPASARRGLPI